MPRAAERGIGFAQDRSGDAHGSSPRASSRRRAPPCRPSSTTASTRCSPSRRSRAPRSPRSRAACSARSTELAARTRRRARRRRRGHRRAPRRGRLRRGARRAPDEADDRAPRGGAAGGIDFARRNCVRRCRTRHGRGRLRDRGRRASQRARVRSLTWIYRGKASVCFLAYRLSSRFSAVRPRWRDGSDRAASGRARPRGLRRALRR